MMATQKDILVLADEATGSELASRIGPGRCACRQDPYDALMDLPGQVWRSIVLSGPREEMQALSSAVRRLAPKSQLFAVCPPAGEPQLRQMPAGLLDDYFIYPPGQDDLTRIRGTSPQATTAAPPVLSPRDLAALVQATANVSQLEAAVAQLVSSRLAIDVQWQTLDDLQGAQPLLIAPGEPPRVLTARQTTQSPQGQALLGDLGECLGALVEAARRTESLHRLAITDHLTGAYNRRYFYHVTDQILQRAARNNTRVTLLLYDIDDFKHYNDTYGYAAGDEILRETAAMMKHITRSHDIVARVGGDEFAVLFWDTDQPRTQGSQQPESPWVLANRFRNAVRAAEFPSLGSESRGVLTVSGALAGFPRDGASCRALLAKADQGLKTAKRLGKDSIQIAGPME